MPKTTSVTLRMDAELKRRSERLFGELGMNMTTAVTVFLKTAVRQGRIPFEISAGAIAEVQEHIINEPETVTPEPRSVKLSPTEPQGEMLPMPDISLELPDEPVWELDV